MQFDPAFHLSADDRGKGVRLPSRSVDERSLSAAARLVRFFRFGHDAVRRLDSAARRPRPSEAAASSTLHHSATQALSRETSRLASITQSRTPYRPSSCRIGRHRREGVEQAAAGCWDALI